MGRGFGQSTNDQIRSCREKGDRYPQGLGRHRSGARTGWTPSIVPEGHNYGCNEAVADLAAAQQMRQGPERIAALKKAGQLRFEADERRKAMRDQERASILELDRQVRAQRLLKSSGH
jgi:hypothetical protein